MTNLTESLAGSITAAASIAAGEVTTGNSFVFGEIRGQLSDGTVKNHPR